jgi:hypothetical protein
MNQQRFMAMGLDPSLILKALRMEPDAWQRDLLLSHEPYVLLNCCRQAGKSRTVSALALHKALFTPGSDIVILSPGQRQSSEVFHKILEAYNAIDRPVKAEYETQLKMELANRSRIICLPGKEETVRCYSPSLIIIDEASRVPDDLYRAVRPMLAASKGRLVALSTPFGQRGWFYKEWEGQGGAQWKRVKATWKDCPRITPEFINEELLAMGQGWVDQEYNCLFTALEGLVYPNIEQCFTDFYCCIGKQVGGIDWGWRNPFAAVWGILDADDVLHIQDQRYLRETPLHEHAKALPRIMWYCDPAGRTEMEEFRSAGHTIRKGFNDIRLGIAALTARIRTGRLRINPLRCPDLVAEAKLYRYPSESERKLVGENPVDDNNHALGALRYLVSRLDSKFIAKLRKTAKVEGPLETDIEEVPFDLAETHRAVFGVKPQPTMNDLLKNPDLWTNLN